jgi:lysophospholipase L1-like esterase
MIVRRCLWLVSMIAGLGAAVPPGARNARASQGEENWIGTWSTAAQPAIPGKAQTFRHQTIRLIVRVSVGGKTLRVRLSNAYGDRPLTIDRARIARRTTAAHTVPTSDRALSFQGKASTTIAARATAVTDPVDLAVPALGELAVSLFFEQLAVATTSHALAQQTNYLSPGSGDFAAEPTFPVAETIDSWPFLTGIDVVAPPRGAAIVAFGSSTTDGDGSTKDANRRWPDILAERLQQHPGPTSELGVLNQGIIGNRLLYDSPSGADNPYGPLLGEAGLTRFDRDVLGQPGVRYVIVGLGINDIIFPAFPFTSPTEQVTAAGIIGGYRQLIARARRAGVRVILTTLGPFEGQVFTGAGLNITTYTPERERLRQAVNAWIRSTNEADAMVDFDAAVRDPSQPTRLRPAYDSGDHLHVNDAGNAAQAAAIPLTLFSSR